MVVALAAHDVRALVVAGGAEGVVADGHLREVVVLRAPRIADPGDPRRPVGLGPAREEVAAGLREEGDVRPPSSSTFDASVDRVPLRDAAEADAHVRLVEEDRARRRVELHVPVADVLHLGAHRLRGRRMGVEVLVELPEAVQRLEGDVERPVADLARVDRLADDVEGLRARPRPASLPAAALTRETSLAGSHVVISFSRRTISAVAASNSARTCAASSVGVVNAA